MHNVDFAELIGMTKMYLRKYSIVKREQIHPFQIASR